MANDFVHLHTHSEYSLLDGLGRIKKLVAEAKRLGQPALALTDHGVMHGAVEFFRACQEGEIKPIIGIEAYQTVWGRPMGGRDAQFDRENYHLLLLAKNMTGYRNLLKIASQSQMNGYYYKPRVDHDLLAKHAEGLIITTGCLGAEVPNLLMQGKEKEAEQRFQWYIDVFGKENFFIELQEHSIPELLPVNKALAPWADKYGINLLATNDVHYVKEEDGTPHDVLLCVQTGALVNAEKRMRLSDKSYFLKSREQMEATFRPFIDLPASAFDNSLRITEMCDVDLEDKEYHLPHFTVPEGHTYETWLRHMTEEGLQRLYSERVHNEEVQERKERELRVIHEMGFDVYFLIVADLCAFARSRNIWYNVRGSGAGSLVAYCTGITGIDPLKNNLIFERFLNPGRVSMPDFDLDFPDDQREELIRYTIKTYGEEQVAQIVTFGRMKARAAIRDVGRAKGVDLKLVDKIAKLIPAIPGKPVTIQDVLTEGHEFYSPELVEMVKKEAWVQDLVETSQKLEGVARHSGIHAAAVIVADRELTHYAPLMRGSKGSITNAITQYEFPILESIGLLKVDFLGLSTLSVMREAGRLIKERHGIEFTLANIPFEGEAALEAFKLLSSGEVSGVFQVESQGMRRVLTEMKPTMFEHIIAMISLYRPGPIEYIPTFIRRMHGEEKVEYKHPSLESILSETYGILVYQEQIIQALSKLAGYTPGEADLVRRAISKKKASDIEKHKKLFIAGCKKNGIDPVVAESIYNDIEFFARYGFNKSHAADYAVITVQTAYLKAIYPVDYMAALLLIERDKTEKVVNFISECRRMGIDVLPPDVNYSGLDFEIQQRPAEASSNAHRDPMLAYPFPIPEGSAIRFGMAAIKNVGEGPVQVIIDARKEGGPFKSLEDFCDRVDLRQVNKRALECLIKVGAFDSFGKRSQLLDVIDGMVSNSAGVHNARESGQLSIFDLMGEGGAAEAAPIRLPNIEEVKGRDKLLWEKELLGVYAVSHPVQQLGIDLRKVVTCACNELDEAYDGKNVVLAGMISSVRTINTKKGDQMAFVQIEDLQGQCEVVVFPRTYTEVKDKLIPDTVMIFKGKAQSREGQTSLLLDSVQTYVDQAAARADGSQQYQKPLFDGTPTINGMPIYEPPATYTSAAVAIMGGEAIDDVDLGQFGEESPFQNELPVWMRGDEVEADGEEDEPPVSRPAAPTMRTSAITEPALAVQNNAAKTPAPPPNGVPTGNQADTPPSTPKRDAAQKAVIPAIVVPAADDHHAHNGNGHSGVQVFEKAPSTNGKSNHAEPDVAMSTLGNADKKSDAPVVSDQPALPTAAPTKNEPAPVTNGNHTNGKMTPTNGHQDVAPKGAPASVRTAPDGHHLQIIFRRSGNLDRDKFRLKEIYDYVRDPRGRDQFFILLESNGKQYELAFPNDGCTVSERLLDELGKHFRVEVTLDGK